nr:hypothetical protein [uncultured Desulfobacter sp.]
MSIDEKKFKETLSQNFIQLLNSEHGVATKLAAAIGKKASSINNVKRNRPVNALHLKAVGIVFGPEKVLELLSIDASIDSGKDDKNHRRLIEIEKESKELYEKVCLYIEVMYETIKTMKKKYLNIDEQQPSLKNNPVGELTKEKDHI